MPCARGGSFEILAMAFFWILLLLATGYQAVLLVSFVIGAVVQTAAYVLLLSVLPFPIEASGLALFFFLLAFNLSALILGRRELLAQTDLSFLQDKALTGDTLSTAAGHQALRNACHNILYTEANASSVSSVGIYGQSPLVTAVEVVLAAAIALLATYFVRRHMKMKRWRAQQQ